MQKNRFLSILLISLLLFLAVEAFILSNHHAQATVLFEDGFESDYTPWTGTSTSSGQTIAISTVEVHHGVKSSLSSFSGSSSRGYALARKTLGSYQDQRYMQVHVRFTALPQNDGSKFFVSAGWYDPPPTEANCRVRAGIAKDGATLKWVIGDYHSSAWYYYYNATPTPQINTWYSVEWFYDASATVGQLKLWIDQVNLVNVTSGNVGGGQNLYYISVGNDVLFSGSETASIYCDCVHFGDAYSGEDVYFGVDGEGVSTIKAGENCTFHAYATSTIYNLSGSIFGTNNTGSWVNETWVPFASGLKEAWTNTSKILTSTIGDLVQWQVWVNNTNSDWVTSGLQNLTVYNATIAKPTYTKRRFGLGYSEMFGLHNEFLTWYTTTKPYYSVLNLYVDTETIVEKQANWIFLRDYIVPEFNSLNIALRLRICTADYDNTTERQEVINVITEDLGSQPCLEKGFIMHDYEFMYRDGNTSKLWYNNKPTEESYKTYWYDWWWNKLKEIDSDYVYVVDKVWSYAILNTVNPDGSPRYLWEQGNNSPSQSEGLDAWVSVTIPTVNFMGTHHSCWQLEAQDNWEDSNWASSHNGTEYGDYWINLNFESYDNKTGTGSSASQKMPYLIYNMEVNMYAWVNTTLYPYDADFEALMQNLMYNNLIARGSTYVLNSNNANEGANVWGTWWGGWW